MSWIKIIPPNNSDESLKNIYKKNFSSLKEVTNISAANSLRPQTIDSTISFEKSLLYSSDNKLPQWFLEAIGVYVSYLNGCEYCIEHYYENMKTFLNNNSRAEEIRIALAENLPEKVFDVWEKVIMKFAEVLTKNPTIIKKENIEELRLCGLEDEEILEVTQAISYFCYTNRIALGLGVEVEDNLLGLTSK